MIHRKNHLRIQNGFQENGTKLKSRTEAQKETKKQLFFYSMNFLDELDEEK